MNLDVLIYGTFKLLAKIHICIYKYKHSMYVHALSITDLYWNASGVVEKSDSSKIFRDVIEQKLSIRLKFIIIIMQEGSFSERIRW